MKNQFSSRNVFDAMVEPLEQRIAPAALIDFGTAVHSSPLRLDADATTPDIPAGLSTSGTGGAFLLYVEKGSALVFTTDLNANGQVDFNEITGISAGEGLRITLFVDLHGDVVTNLQPDFTLTDSDNDATNGRDGRVLLNNSIEMVTLRSVTQGDVAEGTAATDRLALSSYSIFGSIYAGKGFGATDAGLIVDTTGSALQAAKFTGNTGVSQFVQTTPQIGSIRLGTAASGQSFTFGTAAAGLGLGIDGTNIRGELQTFTPGTAQAGADLIGIRGAADTMRFNLGTLQAGDGGFGGRGGDIIDVRIPGDSAGGYRVIAGNAGAGAVGERGGDVTNFADLGSFTSEVVIRSGNGGTSSLGQGGNGGSINFDPAAPQNVNGRFIFQLGKGGDGFTSGGNGGSQPVAFITTPEGAIPFSLSLVTTTRQPGDISVAAGTDPAAPGYHELRGFDFDLDGINDLVYSTADPDQLVVLFGAGGGLFNPLKTLYLNGPANAEALAVADFNNDGHPDIAAASANETLGGVSVYLSSYQPTTGEFQGFREPLTSPLPALVPLGFLQKAVPILAITAGDFDGNGTVDLAVVSTQVGTLGELNVVLIMENDSVPQSAPGASTGSGYFVADFNSGLPFVVLEEPRPILRATALTDGGRDIFIAATAGSDDIFVVSYDGTDGFANALVLGKVDTNREISDPGKMDKIALQDVRIQDFAIVDIDSDGNADVVVLTNQPEGFLITAKGDGAGGFLIGSSPAANGENNGIKITGENTVGLVGDLLVGVLPTDANNDGIVSEIAIVDYSLAAPSTFVFVTELSFVDPGPPVAPANFAQVFKGDTFGLTALIFLIGMDESILAFDTYSENPGETGNIQYNIGYPLKDNRGHDVIVSFGDDFNSPEAALGIPLANNGLFFSAGDGGDGRTGSGGIGGSIGKSLKLVDDLPVGSFNVILPQSPAYEGTVRLISGTGGNGFINGGIGGGITGVSVSYNNATLLTTDVQLFAGAGGNAITGTGGRGGGLSSLAIVTGSFFVAGNGGNGIVGGVGGSVVGNVIPDLPDVNGNVIGGANVESSVIVVAAGIGGRGIKKGGDGGSIEKFTPRFLPLAGGEGGLLHYEAGDGGSALSGVGGKGGSVIDSSPVLDGNNLVGDVYLRGGNGGRGTSGGAGGGISNFVNVPGQGSLPTSLTVLGGNGGAALNGSGGNAGSIVNVKVDAVGNGFQSIFDFTDPTDVGLQAIGLTYNRVIAGNGGDSVGGKGGTGGNVTQIQSSAASSSFAVVAGRGGDGLSGGGRGGNVTASTLSSAAGESKLLIVAGDGGDVLGAVKTTNDPLAFGGSNGRAGGGGDISDIIQTPSTLTHVDLIAGNGGNTVNYGSTLDLSGGIGGGGSIRKVSISGDVGNNRTGAPIEAGNPAEESAAIRSYNDIYSNQRMADFVAATFFAPVGGTLDPLNDLSGNVGIVVGAKGRVRDNNGDGLLDAATAGTNGVLTDVSARNIMSAVAGSVNRIAAIREINNLRSTVVGGTFGADKVIDSYGRLQSGDGVLYTAGTPGFDYLKFDNPFTEDDATIAGPEEDRHSSSPVLGGKLVDGAIIGSNQRTKLSNRDFILG